MEVKSLSDLYKAIGFTEATVYVAPLIPSENTNTSYLYSLYKPLLNHDSFKVESVSVFSHFKPVLHVLLNKKVLLHYHWLEFQDIRALTGMPYKLLCIYLFTLFGGTLVWTIHNEHPHDQKLLGFHLRLHKWMVQRATAVHVHCEAAKTFAKKKLKVQETKIFTLSHPSFEVNILPKNQSKDKLKKLYDLSLIPEKPVWLIFGNISGYKGIEELLISIDKLAIDPQVIVAGPIKKGNKELGKRLKKLTDSSSLVHLVDTLIPDEHVPYFFSSTDLCIFNYTHILSSGVTQLAQDFKKPILAPKKGCISELESDKNVFLFENTEQRDDLMVSKYQEFANE